MLMMALLNIVSSDKLLVLTAIPMDEKLNKTPNTIVILVAVNCNVQTIHGCTRIYSLPFPRR